MDFSEAIKDFSDRTFDTLQEADGFFQKFGKGNAIEIKQMPYERVQYYIELLYSLHKADKAKFYKMHKGTPYFFIAWLSFDLNNYERGYHYVVSGLHEDLKNMPHKKWHEHNVSQFITMDNSKRIPAERIIEFFKNLITIDIKNFNNQKLKHQFTFEELIDKFLKKFIDDNFKNVNIIIALYIFIFDCHFITDDIILGSNNGKSIQSILSNLFNGALVFESLLKQIFKEEIKIIEKKPTLGNIINQKFFLDKYGNGANINSSADTLEDIITALKSKNNEINRAMTVVAKIRNTTAHNLIWDDVFNTPDVFTKLTQQIKNAIFILISDKYINVA